MQVDLQVEDAEANTAETADGKKAKARLVVLGFEDPDIDIIHNDAPTLSKDGRQLLLQKIASNHWELCSFDVSTAFLHGKRDGRVLESRRQKKSGRLSG